jgi:RNA polymerase sigma-70 factor (ECF subfamily)
MEEAGRRGHELFEAARAAQPSLSIDEAGFLAFLEERPERLDAPAERAGELGLVFACVRGDATALRILDDEYLARLPARLPRRLKGDDAEILQLLRVRLLLPDGAGRVKIAEFTGRGALARWLRVAAARVALNAERKTWREIGGDVDETSALANRAAGDLEIDHLKRRYHAEFRAAFSQALDSLDARSRNILKQHYLDGLTMEAVGAIYGVHRVTVVRWIARAREDLAKETRTQLTSRLRVEAGELESILRLIDSQFEVSFRAFLR